MRPICRDLEPLSQRAPVGVLCRAQYRVAQLEQLHQGAGYIEPCMVLAQPAIAPPLNLIDAPGIAIAPMCQITRAR